MVVGDNRSLNWARFCRSDLDVQAHAHQEAFEVILMKLVRLRLRGYRGVRRGMQSVGTGPRVMGIFWERGASGE